MVNFYGKEVSFLKLFGQQRWGDCSPGAVNGRKIYHAAGIVIDRRLGRERVYVADTGNNRILGFRSAGSPTPDLICGQPDEFSGAPNFDCNLGTFGPVSRTSMCLLDVPGNPNLGEQWQRLNFDVGPDGSLYVPDVHNNRVLVFFDPLAKPPQGPVPNVPGFVIGQDDFTSNAINRGQPGCDERSLFLTYDGKDISSHGVSVDAQKNVWVADPGNHRVLRFPHFSKKANLVLGQPDFTSRALHEHILEHPERMCRPTLARIDPDSGKLYVLDEYDDFLSRILVFTPPFTDGMTAEIFHPRFPRRKTEDEEDARFELRYGCGLVFNPYKTDEPADDRGVHSYRDGLLWLNDRWRTMLVAHDRVILLAIAQPNVFNTDGQFADPSAGFNLNWPGGSIAFDSSNNVYIPDEQYYRIARYALPYRPVSTGQTVVPPPANGGLFAGTIPNNVTDANFSGPGVGAITFGNQLIVRDYRRYMVWENYLDATEDGPRASFIAAATGDGAVAIGANRSMHAIDDQNRLWAVTSNFQLMSFQLPLTPTSQPTRERLFWMDGTPVDFFADQALAFDRRNRFLWVFDRRHFRLLRIRRLDGRLVVTAVLGQRSRDEGLINRGMDQPDAASFGIVNDIRFDGGGNLYVVDNTYECHENQRVIVFRAQDLDDISTPFPLTEARIVFVANSFRKAQTCGADVPHFVDKPSSPVCVAFNSKGWMVLGNDGYYSNPRDRQRTQLYLYRTPLAKQDPDAVIELSLGAPGEISFDAQDNLIVQDHIWNKLWVINFEKDPAWLRELPPP